QFARLLFRAPRVYPIGELRVLKFTITTGGDHDGDHERLRQLLRANPRLEDLTLRTAPSLLPIRDISDAVALRSLTVDYVPRVRNCNPRRIAEVLSSIAATSECTLEQFELVGVAHVQGVPVESVPDVWPRIDAALCQFPALKRVGMAVPGRMPAEDEYDMQAKKQEEAIIRVSIGNLLPSTRARSILDVTFEDLSL
ncbi:hypothetical protein GGF50DRAFT_65983, partial [Schizophyllum commune]